MNIAIIGTGNIGGTLAQQFIKAGHTVLVGARFPLSEKSIKLATKIGEDRFTSLERAVKQCDVVVIAVPAQFAGETARSLGDVSGKVIIDTMNVVAMKPDGFTNTCEAILANCNTSDVVKCFNSTGFENISDPGYPAAGIDMFTAGSSEKGVAIATHLAKEIGFENVYHFGGNDKFNLLEQMALCWINLAIVQKQGRDIAFKIVRR